MCVVSVVCVVFLQCDSWMYRLIKVTLKEIQSVKPPDGEALVRARLHGFIVECVVSYRVHDRQLIWVEGALMVRRGFVFEWGCSG